MSPRGEAGGYPRIYRYALWATVLVGVAGAGCVAGAVVLLIVVLTAPTGAPGSLAWALAGLAALAGVGALFILSMVRSRVVLTADAVTLHGTFRARTLARADIAGRRLLALQYGQKVTVLCPKDPRVRALRISSYLRTDAVCNAWIAELPDLDAQAARALEEEVAADPELGQTPHERLGRLKAARRLANAANFVTYAIVLWAYLYPRPYHLVLLALAALPWLAIVVVARSHGLYRVDSQRNDPRPTLAIPIIIPGFVLMLRAILDVGVLDVPRALIYAALTAGLMIWAALMSDAALRKVRWLTLLIFGLFCAYGYGAAVLANTELDRAPGEQFRVPVLSGHVTRGKTTSYYLRVGPWGPRTEPADVDVSGALYAQVRPGDRVCVHLGPGALGISWYLVERCP